MLRQLSLLTERSVSSPFGSNVRFGRVRGAMGGFVRLVNRAEGGYIIYKFFQPVCDIRHTGRRATMKLRVSKARAREDWLGIFYIGWVQGPGSRYGLSVSFGKLTYLLCWK